VAKWNPDRFHAMRHPGPKLILLCVDKPQTAAVRPRKIAGKIGVQPHDLVNLLLTPDPRGIFKDCSNRLIG
jgi:hypothetical protein